MMLSSMVKIRQRFQNPSIGDSATVTADQLRSARVSEIMRPGDQVGIAVGSDGIGVVENACGQIAKISAVTPSRFVETDDLDLLDHDIPLRFDQAPWACRLLPGR